MLVRWMAATLLLALSGVFVTPGGAQAVPGFCPPICDAIPDSAWIEPGSLPLVADLPVACPGRGRRHRDQRRGSSSSRGASAPASSTDPRRYAVAARAAVPNPDGQWNLQVQVIHWRGDTVTGGKAALETLEKAASPWRRAT